MKLTYGDLRVEYPEYPEAKELMNEWTMNELMDPPELEVPNGPPVVTALATTVPTPAPIPFTTLPRIHLVSTNNGHCLIIRPGKMDPRLKRLCQQFTETVMNNRNAAPFKKLIYLLDLVMIQQLLNNNEYSSVRRFMEDLSIIFQNRSTTNWGSCCKHYTASAYASYA